MKLKQTPILTILKSIIIVYVIAMIIVSLLTSFIGNMLLPMIIIDFKTFSFGEILKISSIVVFWKNPTLNFAILMFELNRKRAALIILLIGLFITFKIIPNVFMTIWNTIIPNHFPVTFNKMNLSVAVIITMIGLLVSLFCEIKKDRHTINIR